MNLRQKYKKLKKRVKELEHPLIPKPENKVQNIETETIGYRMLIDLMDFYSLGNLAIDHVRKDIALKLADQIADRMILEHSLDQVNGRISVRGKIRVVKDELSLEPLSWSKHTGAFNPNPFIDHDDSL